MAKKQVEGIVAELKKLMASDKLVFGSERTIKMLRDKGIKKVFLSSNCEENKKEMVMHLCKINGVPVEQLDKSAEDIGVVCRKPFSVSIIGVL
ncbi:ribosomal L7Ae/L30e/S12e/Gadd45 family protein [Candidatus Woesearchaeota archaeon]|nr:ribosomal L7Ae/L30e/S12e/Gadd45 family protein [Candidatus Woesearchaeota archaeon]